MLDVALVLLAIALLLVVAGGIQPLAARLSLPPPVLLAIFGIAIGTVSSLVPKSALDGAAQLFQGLPITSETIIYVFLPLLVFEAGVTSDVRRILGTLRRSCCWRSSRRSSPRLRSALPCGRWRASRSSSACCWARW
jgi:Kef-type K+ transport system membrane component KefB